MSADVAGGEVLGAVAGMLGAALALIPSSPGLPPDVRQWLYDRLGGLLTGQSGVVLRQLALALALAAPAVLALAADWWLRRPSVADDGAA